jgi:hypothetical protein
VKNAVDDVAYMLSDILGRAEVVCGWFAIEERWRNNVECAIAFLLNGD